MTQSLEETRKTQYLVNTFQLLPLNLRLFRQIGADFQAHADLFLKIRDRMEPAITNTIKLSYIPLKNTDL